MHFFELDPERGNISTNRFIPEIKEQKSCLLKVNTPTKGKT